MSKAFQMINTLSDLYNFPYIYYAGKQCRPQLNNIKASNYFSEGCAEFDSFKIL